MIQPKKKARKKYRYQTAAIEKTLESIALGYKPQQIWLYGSFLRGDFHQGSDVDLIIIKETDIRFIDRIEEVLQYCPGGIAVEPLVYTSRELETMLAEGNSFLEQVFSEGMLVYEQQS